VHLPSGAPSPAHNQLGQFFDDQQTDRYADADKPLIETEGFRFENALEEPHLSDKNRERENKGIETKLRTAEQGCRLKMSLFVSDIKICENVDRGRHQEHG
jgi:hypothetical protein